MNIKNTINSISLSTILLITSMFNPNPTVETNTYFNNEIKNNKVSTSKIIELEKKLKIKISFIGDCTLGTDKVSIGQHNDFDEIMKKNNYDPNYCVKNIKIVFEEDDLSVANLEGTFTTNNYRRDKDIQFNFKGDPSYVDILKAGSIEVVNLGNNHSFDYGEETSEYKAGYIGYLDTINTLKKANVDYYGSFYEQNVVLIKEIKGIKVGFIGLTSFDNFSKTLKLLKEDLEYLKENDVLIKVVTFHWGIERKNYHNSSQEKLAKAAIDNGADLIVGHHPHVIQGIEEYNGKNIIYSLGNGIFGGNRNPKDKTALIYQETFTIENNKLINTEGNIIPISISSISDYNNFQPKVLETKDKIKVLERIKKYSK